MTFPDTKRCPKCGFTKSRTEFHANKNRPGGCSAHCKNCVNSKRRTDEYRTKRNRRYAEDIDHHEKIKRQQRARKRTPEYRQVTNKYRRERSANDPEFKAILNKANLKWRIKYPERAKMNWKKGKAARRAREKAAVGKCTIADIKNIYDAQKGRCYYCKKEVGLEYHLDHIVPLSRGGSNAPENIAVACPSCNLSKGDKLPHEWPEGGKLL